MSGTLLLGFAPMKFKTVRVRDEFYGSSLDPRARAIAFAQAWHIERAHGYLYEITEIYRTYDEQRGIYPDEANKVSTHQLWRAFDGVVREFTPAHYRELEAWTNKYFPYLKAGCRTCLYHEAGLGFHLHNQVAPVADMRDFVAKGKKS